VFLCVDDIFGGFRDGFNNIITLDDIAHEVFGCFSVSNHRRILILNEVLDFLDGF